MTVKDKTPKADIVPLRGTKTARRGQQAAATIQAQENEKLAYELRRAGVSYTEIAERLGVALSTAHGYVMGVLERTAGLAPETVEAVRQMEVERLDRLLQGVWPRATAGDNGAVWTAVKLIDRRAKLLGLDAPQRTELTGAEGGPIEVNIDARALLAGRLDGLASRKQATADS